MVRLLIRHSECMGPALAGDALGLYAVYKEAIENHLESEPPSHVDTKCELGGVNESFSSSRSSLFSRQSTMSTILNNSLSTRTILTYYTSLVRLLASCAPHVTAHIPSGHTHNKGGNQRTQNILRNLIKIEDIVNILALAYTTEEEQGVSPAHKMAVVWFLERVYKISDPEVLLELLSRGFLPDIKLALQTASMVCCMLATVIREIFMCQKFMWKIFMDVCCSLFRIHDVKKFSCKNIFKVYMFHRNFLNYNSLSYSGDSDPIC